MLKVWDDQLETTGISLVSWDEGGGPDGKDILSITFEDYVGDKSWLDRFEKDPKWQLND